MFVYLQPEVAQHVRNYRINKTENGVDLNSERPLMVWICHCLLISFP